MVKIRTHAVPVALNENVNIDGWERSDGIPTVKIEQNIEDFVEKGVAPQIRVKETEDRQGVVTSRKEYHYVLATYAFKAYAKIAGPQSLAPISIKQIKEEKINKQLHQ